MTTPTSELVLMEDNEFYLLAPWELAPTWRYDVFCYELDHKTWLASEPYIRDLMDYSTEPPVANKNEEYVASAFCIYNNFDSKWKVEAYILAGATDEQLLDIFPEHLPDVFHDHSLNCTPKTFEYYRKLFFDVESYQDNINLVLNCILGPGHEKATKISIYDLLSKHIAHNKDISLVDDFIECITEGSMGKELKKTIRGIMATQAALYDSPFSLGDSHLIIVGVCHELCA